MSDVDDKQKPFIYFEVDDDGSKVASSESYFGTTKTGFRSYVAALMLLTVSGNLYGISDYASAIKAQKGFNDAEISLVESMANLGFCIGPWAGWVVDYKGPKAACICALTICVICYCATAIVLGSKGGSAGLLTFLFWAMGQGSMFAYIAGISAYQHFPTDRQGVAIGMLDSMFGLSAAIFSALYSVAFNGTSDEEEQHVASFFFFMAVASAVANGVGMVMLTRPPPPVHTEEVGRLSIEGGRMSVTAQSKIRYSVSNNVRDSDAGSNVNSNNVRDSDAGSNVNSSNSSDVLGSLPVPASLLQVDFWGLFLFFTLIQANGLLFITNVSFIADSLKMSNARKSAINLIWPLTSAFCRLAIGMFSDYVQARVSRGALLAGCSLVMVFADIFIINEMEQLEVAAVLIGCTFGGSWCLTPLLVGEEFGVESFGFNWSFILIGSGIGGFLFQPLQAHLYQSHSEAGGSDCYGQDCFKGVFVAAAVATVFATILAAALSRYWRKGAQVV
jgi:MFS family permease